MTPAIGEDINQPMVPPQFGQPINPQINITGGKTRKRRKYKKRKSKKVLVV